MNVLSLCMIVKNEEHNLGRCLASVKPYVSEIIIVDTGSTDKTKEVAAAYTDKIYDFEWIDDFAAARNFSLSKAKNDWVIGLDADELVIDWDMASAIEFINSGSGKKDIGMLKLLNRIDKYSQDEVTHESVIPRIFNRKHCFYTGAIHEQVYPGGDEHAPMRQVALKITLFHSGYTEEAMSREDKRARNRRLLENELKKTPDNPYYKYQLGKEYINIGRETEGIRLLEDVLSDSDTVKSGYFSDVVHCLGSIYCRTERFEDAIKLKRLEDFMSHSSDYRFILGHAYIGLESYIEAAFQFLCAIQVKNAMLKGADTYLAFEAMGTCYQNLGELDDALILYEKAFKDYDYLPAKIKYDDLKRYMETL